MNTTAGSLALLGAKPLRDSFVAQRLREAGINRCDITIHVEYVIGYWVEVVDKGQIYLGVSEARRDVGNYGALRQDSAYRVLPLDLHPVEVAELTWHDSTARVVGPRPALVFRLPADRLVTAIRLRYRYRSDDGTLPYIGIRWKPSSQPEFVPERFYKYSPTGDRANWERGTWDTIHDALRAKVRRAAGKRPKPSVAIVDSQTVKGTEHSGPNGYDGGKKGRRAEAVRGR